MPRHSNRERDRGRPETLLNDRIRVYPPLTGRRSHRAVRGSGSGCRGQVGTCSAPRLAGSQRLWLLASRWCL